jgi:chemotaxis protein histidine kinase CheA
MMQAMGVPPTGQVAIAVAQRSVLQNPGGATGNLGGAATQRRRSLFRRQIQQGTPTNGNNPVATQLLLAPTFTPVQANAVLDQANMRIAVPVSQVDGEYILTMQVMGAAQAAQPAAPQAAAAAGASQAPTAAEPKPAAEAAKASPSAAAELKPEGAGNSTETAKLEAAAKPERRADDSKDKYGATKPPQGTVIMSMKDIDTMANFMTWGGQVAITKMMSEYVKAQTGMDMAPVNGTSADAGVQITV